MSTPGTNPSEIARGAYGHAPASYREAGAVDGWRSPSYWVVCASSHSPPEPEEVMCITGEAGDASGDGHGHHDRSRALAVFSFKEEAEAFSKLRVRGGERRVRGFDGGELISLLYGLWGGFSRVALDPIPEDEHRAADGLVIVSREEFVKLLVSRASYPSPQPIR